jgi:asparaginyl-tRNA synthetase
MSEYTEISKILAGKLKDKEVKIHGWLHHKRSQGGISFWLIRDGTGIMQTTLRKDKIKGFEETEKTPVESTVQIKGIVKEDKRSPRGFEIQADEVQILFKADEDFPISKKYHGPEFLLDQRHFWVRSKKMQTIMRIRAAMIRYAREWFEKEGFTEIHVPVIVGAACEGGSTLFEMKYFDRKAYLTQSWQLYAEAVISALGKIYTLAPSFRAEKSRTRRHLTEYWHLEAEAPFCDLRCIMKVQEELIAHILHSLAKTMPEELKSLGRDPKYLLSIKTPFKKVTYDEALKILEKEGVKLKWGDDIDWRHEKVLTMKFDAPFFLTHFPKGIKAFYHKPDPKRSDVTLSADLLAPEGYGEVIGGGQRIHDYDELMKRIKEDKLDVSEYQWYIDLRKYGTIPHSGFGLGIERLLRWICKLKHIRDAILFPRLINRVYP